MVFAGFDEAWDTFRKHVEASQDQRLSSTEMSFMAGFAAAVNVLSGKVDTSDFWKAVGDRPKSMFGVSLNPDERG